MIFQDSAGGAVAGFSIASSSPVRRASVEEKLLDVEKGAAAATTPRAGRSPAPARHVKSRHLTGTVPDVETGTTRGHGPRVPDEARHADQLHPTVGMSC